MKRHHFARAATIVLLGTLTPMPGSPGHRPLASLGSILAQDCSAAEEPAIDFARARELMRKRQSGGKLTPDEEAYLDRARQEFQRRNPGNSPASANDGGPSQADLAKARQLRQKQNSGQKLTEDEETFLQRITEAFNQRKSPAPKPDGKEPTEKSPVSDPEMVKALVPLNQLEGTYKGQDGGLYGNGQNTPPADHLAAYLRESARVQPLDARGNPSGDGKIVLLSIGMSNTTMEFSRFKQTADADPDKAANVVIVDGAQGGKTGLAWAADRSDLLPEDDQQRIAGLLGGRGPKANGGVWATAEERLTKGGVTPEQVQVLWIKHAEARPKGFGEFPDHARVLEADIIATLNIARQKFPNLRVAYLSSRIFGGYATVELNPEPYAYEEAFSMRWVIQDQIKGEPRLNYDPARGEVRSPLVVWGPYLWANGTTPRKSDGLVWNPGDFVTSDHTHPDNSGRQKVADLLLKFLKSDPGASRWFTRTSP